MSYTKEQLDHIAAVAKNHIGRSGIATYLEQHPEKVEAFVKPYLSAFEDERYGKNEVRRDKEMDVFSRLPAAEIDQGVAEQIDQAVTKQLGGI